jgi:hypothetical protein
MIFNPDTYPPSRPWFRAFAVVILTLASTLSIVNTAVLFRYLQQGKVDANTHQLQELSHRQESLSRKLDALEDRPPPATVAAMSALRTDLDTRLTQLEQGHGLADLAQRLDALQARLDKIQTERSNNRKARQADARPAQVLPATPSTPESPTFRVMGIEVRGGERFVSILAAGDITLSQTRLLRPGDMEGAWKLDRIEDQAAVFQSARAGAESVTRRLALP